MDKSGKYVYVKQHCLPETREAKNINVFVNSVLNNPESAELDDEKALRSWNFEGCVIIRLRKDSPILCRPLYAGFDR